MKITFFFLSISLAVVTAAPRSRRQGVWFGGRLNEHSTTFCKKLSPKMEEYCGYSHTYYLDDMGHHGKTFQEAEKEFNDFRPLIDSQCSSYLGTLLCFYYFPQSNCKGLSAVELRDNRIDVLPCRKTCEDAKNDTCVSYAQRNHSNWTWPIQFQNCSQFPSSGACAYGKKMTAFPKSQPPTNIPDVLIDIIVKELPTEEPFTDKEEKDTTPECPTECSFRQIARSKTFQKKNKYTFAIKAEIISQMSELGKFNVSVIENFDVQDCNDNSDNVMPVKGQIVTICVPCKSPDLISAEVNKTVLIGGSFADGELVLDCKLHKPLFGEWLDKYNPRMSKWIGRYRQECTQ